MAVDPVAATRAAYDTAIGGIGRIFAQWAGPLADPNTPKGDRIAMVEMILSRIMTVPGLSRGIVVDAIRRLAPMPIGQVLAATGGPGARASSAGGRGAGRGTEGASGSQASVRGDPLTPAELSELRSRFGKGTPAYVVAVQDARKRKRAQG